MDQEQQGSNMHSRYHPIGALLLLFGALGAGFLQAQEQMVLRADQDTSLFEEGGLSNGGGQYLFAGVIKTGPRRRALLRFPIEQMPSGATITSVSLQMNVSRIASGSLNPLSASLHRINADWQAGTVDAESQEGMGAPAQSGDATWVYRQYASEVWLQSGGDFNPTVSANAFIIDLGQYEWASVGMVADVQAWLDKSVDNFGWVVVENSAASFGTAKRFDSSEHPDMLLQPLLTVNYLPPPRPMTLTMVAEGFSAPVAAKSPRDGSDRLFVVEQSGVVKVIAADGSVASEPLLDLSAASGSGLTASSGERGLLGLAFDPDFSTNGYFYLNYTDNPGVSVFNTVVARYTVSDSNSDVADPASALVILTVAQDFANHNGGDLHFGPDGFLYVGMGDGGGGGDPNSRAQDQGSLLGKMLRIDVDQPALSVTGACSAISNYSVPADNPFINISGVCPEIWASGLRNPYRFSFDLVSGDIFMGDVGQRRIEEIDIAPAGEGGLNFGWDCREGTTEYGSDSGDPGSPADSCVSATNLVDPIIEYEHASGRCSITGGYSYRGSIASLHGRYIYGDYCTGEILVATEAVGVWNSSILIDPLAMASDYCPGKFCLSGFGEDANGEILVVDRGGRIYRIIESELVFADSFEAMP